MPEQKPREVPSVQLTEMARVQVTEDGRVHFEFEQPVPYAYVAVLETSGETQEFRGTIRSVTASISDANREQFVRLLINAPYTAYLDPEHLDLAGQMAVIFGAERPAVVSEFPGQEHVPGFTLRGRPSLAPLLDHNVEDLTYLRYPKNIPLQLEIDPLTNKVVEDSARVNGSPDLGTVVALTKEIVGLTGNSGYGGPDGYAPLARLHALDLQEDWVADYVAAGAELRRMHRVVQAEARRRLGLPSITRVGDKIVMFTGGRGDEENYLNETSTCVSLLTGRTL